MKLDDLRSILLSERETGRLTAVAPDIFEKGHAELAAITKKVYAFEDPFSDDARALIDETLAIRETIQDLFAIRSRKISLSRSCMPKAIIMIARRSKG